MKTFICSYKMDGESWCLYLKAESQEDAERRLAYIRLACTVDGELMATVPATPITGPILGAICAVRNFFRSR